MAEINTSGIWSGGVVMMVATDFLDRTMMSHELKSTSRYDVAQGRGHQTGLTSSPPLRFTGSSS